MDFGFNDEYKMIQKMYREFAEKEIKRKKSTRTSDFPRRASKRWRTMECWAFPSPKSTAAKRATI